MANDFSSNPLILDGVMASGYQTLIAGVPNNLTIYPRVIKWDAPVAAGDVFEIDDHLGNILFKHTCVANGQGETFDVAEGVRWEALWQLITLASGKLYIYFTT
jgi:hypothetical protein